ncbi:hypothetical protein Cgig2_006660 [Carnegiea gigantea]|uniref:Neprosin domain-containing protein n=1 Tax=Carnegiea gigantea TaxID=171969 RepID=A0A9Q1Q933_9CARY|nr:hypothetical protein Cgig2_006660 [Carnegiea gigantea]
MLVQKEDGSTIDCIDIYKQPAFDHPLLKNQELRMKPSSLLQEKMTMSSLELEEEDEIILSNSTSKSKFPGCPSGTVPIRRTQKEDLIRASSPLRNYPPMPNALPSDFTPPQGMHYAGLSTPEGATDQYLGARLSLTVHNLTMMIPEQISAASARVGTAADAPFASIEFGWTADGFEKTGSFNMLCPGFVQVCQYGILGEGITDFTEYGKELKYLYFAIGKIADKVFIPSVEPAKTPMGSGHLVPRDLLRTASADFKLLNTSLGFTSEPQMVVLTNMPDSYQAQYLDGNNVVLGGPDIQKSSYRFDSSLFYV